MDIWQVNGDWCIRRTHGVVDKGGAWVSEYFSLVAVP